MKEAEHLIDVGRWAIGVKGEEGRESVVVVKSLLKVGMWVTGAEGEKDLVKEVEDRRVKMGIRYQQV